MSPRLLVCLLCLTSCSDKADDTGDTASTTEVTSATPTTGDAEPCAMYESEELGPGVQFTFKNMTDGPVWVPASGCGGVPALSIIDAAGTDGTNRFASEFACSPATCQEFLGPDDCSQACDDCLSTIASRVEAGSSIKVDWPGGHGEPMMLTTECASGVLCEFTPCVRPTRAPPATYAVALRVYTECLENCECEASEAGWCAITGDKIQFVASDLQAKATFDYPGAAAIELTITGP